MPPPSVHISLEGPRERWFTNHDIIKGQVKVNVKTSTEVKKISVGFAGVSVTHLARVDDVGQKFVDRVEENCSLTSSVEQLFPPQGAKFASSYALKPDTYSLPFQFEVPMHSICLQKGILPPSLSDVDNDVAYIRYAVTAELEYLNPVLGIGTNSSTIEVSVPIVILPTDPEDINNVPTYGVIHTSKSLLIPKSKLGGIISRLKTSLVHDRSPSCGEIAKFTARMEFLLTPGRKVDWNLEAVCTGSRPIIVVGVKVLLLAITHVRAKNLDQTIDHSQVIFERSKLALHSGDLTSQLEAAALVLPESVPPTFRAPNIQREYRIEIRVHWSHEGSDLEHKALLRRKVWVRSGMQVLPDYETEEIVRPDRGFPQRKWYYR